MVGTNRGRSSLLTGPADPAPDAGLVAGMGEAEEEEEEEVGEEVEVGEEGCVDWRDREREGAVDS